MELPFMVRSRCSMVGFGALVKELGLWKALKAGAVSETLPDPFRTLAAADGEGERLSRMQIGPAINLYKALQGDLGTEKALAVVKTVVEAATQPFLKHTVGDVGAEQWRALTDEGRAAFAGVMAEKFFNATGRLGAVSADGFDFTVDRCLFAGLCAGAGVPELAPVFCDGDLHYFSRGPIKLLRTVTLSANGKPCDFRFRIE